MKNRISWRGSFALGVACISILGVLAGDNRAGAQQGQGIYFTQASNRLAKLIDGANKAGYRQPNNSFSIAGGWIKQSQTNWVPIFTVELEAGKEYRFLAAGDNDARDVDLQIQDADGKTVALDDDTNLNAIVDFQPSRSGRYTVRIRLYESRENLPCACLAVMMAK